MAEPQDTPPSTPPPLPPKKPGGGVPPPAKPTARVPAVGASQPPKPYSDPFAVEEEAASTVDQAMKNLPPPLPSAQSAQPASPPAPIPRPAAAEKDVAARSGQTMRISIPQEKEGGSDPDASVSNQGKKPVQPQPPLASAAANEPQEDPALLPGAYTQQIKPPELPAKPAKRLPDQEARKVAEQELSRIENWLGEAPADSPSSPAPEPPAKETTVPPPIPEASKPKATEPSASSTPGKPSPPPLAKEPGKVKGSKQPPRLSGVEAVDAGAATGKERKPVDLPKMQMLDKKPQKLLSRQRKEKEQEEAARQREARMKSRLAAGTASTSGSDKKADSLDQAASKAAAGDSPKPKVEATPGKTPVKKKTSSPLTPTPTPRGRQEPEAAAEKVIQPKKMEQDIPVGAEKMAKKVGSGEKPLSAKPSKAASVEEALPAVVPVALKGKSQSLSGVAPAKPTKAGRQDPDAAKPQKAQKEQIAKPLKADEAEKIEQAKVKEAEAAARDVFAPSQASETSGGGEGGFKDLSFPTVDHKNRKPAPLLSRQRRERRDAANVEEGAAVSLGPGAARGARERATKSPAPRQLAAAPGRDSSAPKTPVAPPSPRQQLLMRLGTYAAVMAATLGVGFLSYYFLRETQVVGDVLIKPGSGFKLEEVAVVRDFRGDLAALAQDLAEERGPLRREVRDLERSVALAKEDMVGREARLQYLREDIIKEQQEIEEVLGEARVQAEAIWEGPGSDLDEQYQVKLEETKERIQRRAEQLQLNYRPSDEFESPEVWVNAFRLALYDAPTGVNPGQERQWAESVLREWQEYNQEWRRQVADLKKEVSKIQAKPRQQIEDIRRNIADLKARIALTEVEMKPLRDEITFNSARLQEKRELEASLEEPKYKQVLQSANTAMILKPLKLDPESGRFEWNHIQADPRFEPGRYLLWVRATRDGEEYWAFARFPIIEDTTTQLIIEQTRLQSVRQALRTATVQPLSE